jgi:hypothetical protein
MTLWCICQYCPGTQENHELPNINLFSIQPGTHLNLFIVLLTSSLLTVISLFVAEHASKMIWIFQFQKQITYKDVRP